MATHSKRKAKEDVSPLLFSWSTKGLRRGSFAFFFLVALLLHALVFYLFRLAFPSTSSAYQKTIAVTLMPSAAVIPQAQSGKSGAGRIRQSASNSAAISLAERRGKLENYADSGEFSLAKYPVYFSPSFVEQPTSVAANQSSQSTQSTVGFESGEAESAAAFPSLDGIAEPRVEELGEQSSTAFGRKGFDHSATASPFQMRIEGNIAPRELTEESKVVLALLEQKLNRGEREKLKTQLAAMAGSSKKALMFFVGVDASGRVREVYQDLKGIALEEKSAEVFSEVLQGLKFAAKPDSRVEQGRLVISLLEVKE